MKGVILKEGMVLLETNVSFHMSVSLLRIFVFRIKVRVNADMEIIAGFPMSWLPEKRTKPLQYLMSLNLRRVFAFSSKALASADMGIVVGFPMSYLPMS